MTIACVAVFPNPPGHHFVAVNVGECTMNSFFRTSYVHVVSNPLMNVPWPNSVCAYVPTISKFTHLGNQYFFCSSVPCPWMVGMNIPRCKSSPPGSSMNSRTTRAMAINLLLLLLLTPFPLSPLFPLRLRVAPPPLPPPPPPPLSP